MGKNILIFSDGTGQAGGLIPDEAHSNVYKLFRAARCGPDSSIDPAKQLAFYDPGLGSKADGSAKVGRLGRWIYDTLSQATGLGITRNIIDCYAAIVRMWEPGDRIYLFGFSRGAYTVRCVGGVLGLCGVPTRMKDGSPLKRDPASAEMIAAEAVKNVYQYGSSVKGDPHKPIRLQLAEAFRRTYGSANDGEPNAVPYFIGVWDTVSTLGLGYVGLTIVALAGFAAATTAAKYLLPLLPGFPRSWSWTASAIAVLVVAAAIYGLACIRYQRLISLAKYRMAFYDTNLNPLVDYARHALSIDENRKDFDRVPWAEDASVHAKRSAEGPERFEQIWFAGNHCDVGGGYAENESRLSDIALQWMAAEARSLPHPIAADASYLVLSPDSGGPQHDERKAALARMWRWVLWCALRFVDRQYIGWTEGWRDVPPDAPLHPSVVERFAATAVLQYDDTLPYRPEPLRNHHAVKQYYGRAIPS